MYFADLTKQIIFEKREVYSERASFIWLVCGPHRTASA